jgi:4-hydroxy-3-polyprenylbenzoate decarboxylase
MNPSAPPKQIVVGITGASGAAYARRLIQCLVGGGAHVHLVVSPLGRRVMADELGISSIDADTLLECSGEALSVYPHRDVGARIASGSFLTHGMIVCPCSANTLGAIASGISDNLLTRAAAVTLKEARPLILVPREMPLSPIDLRNALRCSRAGAVICPAAPGFYLKPQRVEDLVDFVVGRLLDLVGVGHRLNVRWTGSSDAGRVREGDR